MTKYEELELARDNVDRIGCLIARLKALNTYICHYLEKDCNLDGNEIQRTSAYCLIMGRANAFELSVLVIEALEELGDLSDSVANTVYSMPFDEEQ